MCQTLTALTSLTSLASVVQVNLSGEFDIPWWLLSSLAEDAVTVAGLILLFRRRQKPDPGGRASGAAPSASRSGPDEAPPQTSANRRCGWRYVAVAAAAVQLLVWGGAIRVVFFRYVVPLHQ